MDLKNLMVDTKSAWVSFPGFKDFEVELVNLSRPALQALHKKCTEHKFDRKTRAAIETLNTEKYISEFTKATVKNWRGLKLKYLEQLMLINRGDMSEDDELGYSQDNAELLVTSSSQFDDWLTDAVFDLDSFRDKPKGNTVGSAG